MALPELFRVSTPSRAMSDWRPDSSSHPVLHSKGTSETPSASKGSLGTPESAFTDSRLCCDEFDSQEIPTQTPASKGARPRLPSEQPEMFDMASPLPRPMSETKPCHSGTPSKCISGTLCAKATPAQCKVELPVLSPEVDAWNMDDWGAPASDDEPSVLGPAVLRTLTEEQRRIADVVKAEMQANMESLIRGVVTQMSTEEEEYTQMQDMVCKIGEDSVKSAWQREEVEARNTLANLLLRVEELELSCKEHSLHSLYASEDDCGEVPEERSVVDPLPLSSPRTHAMKAQACTAIVPLALSPQRLYAEKQAIVPEWKQGSLRLEVDILSLQNKEYFQKLATHGNSLERLCRSEAEREIKYLALSRQVSLHDCKLESLKMRLNVGEDKLRTHDSDVERHDGDMDRLSGCVAAWTSLAAELQSTQAEIKDEICQSRDLLHKATKWV